MISKGFPAEIATAARVLIVISLMLGVKLCQNRREINQTGTDARSFPTQFRGCRCPVGADGLSGWAKVGSGQPPGPDAAGLAG
jgi:hypothetical protein